MAQQTRMIILDEEETAAEKENIKKMKWGTKTTYGYTKAFTNFGLWLHSSHPEMIAEGNLTPQFSSTALIEFCTKRKKKQKEDGKLVNLSFNGLSQFRSAVKWKLKSQKMRLSEEEEEELKDFFSGLKKRCQREKQIGERDMEEGKREMPFQIYTIGNWGVLKENGVASGNVTREVLEDVMKRMLEGDREQRRREEEIIRRVDGDKEQWEAFLWGDGKFHRLPESFVFPHLTVFQCWNMWWCGNRGKKVPPFSLLDAVDVPKRERKRFSDVRCIMREVMAVVKEKFGMDVMEIRQLSGEQILELGQKGVELLGKTVKKQEVRWKEWMLTTALREVRQSRTVEDPEKKRKQKAPVRRGERAKKRRRQDGK
eukprot:CAMPEP_0201540720 /NCGR_PEP_ID=MMETSP0161_2-20130828/71093_1 /ASSEMBLY_ACC=CAM_ASM_000251 /TAXON_ID=180227 /ORGANISM="Neoparamoeba aestuarina, Strain SoJaBio B1-5/56/2" /LENGTH=368 /DNA_ID=CAMNT_0047948207 /DNA_START=3089 /DNA_END=4195 /DNA_ORIENTATION=+